DIASDDHKGGRADADASPNAATGKRRTERRKPLRRIDRPDGLAFLLGFFGEAVYELSVACLAVPRRIGADTEGNWRRFTHQKYSTCVGKPDASTFFTRFRPFQPFLPIETCEPFSISISTGAASPKDGAT